MQNNWSNNASNGDAPETIQDILGSLFRMQSNGGPNSSDAGARTISLSGITIQDLRNLLGSRSLTGLTSANAGQNIFEDDDDDEDEDDEDDEYDHDVMFSSHQRQPQQWFPPVEEPQKAGVELLNSGDFGRVVPKIRSRRNDSNIVRVVSNNFAKPIPRLHKEDLTGNLIPNTNGTTVASYDANIYTAQFSDDSSFYYTCAQDFKLHIFDMNSPRVQYYDTASTLGSSANGYLSNLKTSLPIRKVIQGHPGRWTITDANLSPDNERMIYSSITSTVYMTSTSPDGSSVQTPIPFGDVIPMRTRHPSLYDLEESFGIWSCRFSADGNEVVAGGSRKIFVYDLLANRRTVKIAAHTDDVNSCCWADTASGNVLVSASDDTFIKVWDRRSLGASQKPSGVLIGHTEGITNVSAKGDGRYIISNGKDQALRLWDLRKMRSSEEYEEVEHKHYGVHNFDYRYPHYPKPKYSAHPKDCSVMTYRGHSVLRTLIRCHFSPAATTGGQYIYSGSADGRVHIWSLDGRIVQVLDRSKTLPASFSPSGPEPEATNASRSSICVRDVSWHSQEPVLMSAGWESGRGGSVIARHEWKGLSKMPGSIEDWAEKKRLEQSEEMDERRHSNRLRERARMRAMQRLPGSFIVDDDDDDMF